ncbi:MAG TPA: hypothetical protein VFQ45_04270 [Longimicrobium sp.]|nr:hypothetical protein [Longimicrobium sp.]
MRRAYDDQVFVNCPFDDEYRPFFQALLFTVHACGMVARSALEVDDGAEVRIDKIARIIAECRHGIHDLSRIEPDERSGYPRMNMPFELGLFLGAKRYGDPRQKRKTCIIFDRERYRYQQFLSDLAGHDIRAHHGQPDELIRAVRNGLASTRPAHVLLPSGRSMAEGYAMFRADLPRLCHRLRLDPADLGHRDLAWVITEWLQQNPGHEHSAN